MDDQPRLTAISFLQSFVTQSVKAANQMGCSSCSSRFSLIEQLGLGASGCLEETCRAHTGLDNAALTPRQYADMIVWIKNQIGGDFSQADSEPGVVRVVNRRCPFGEAVREAPELCRMTASVFGGVAARNFGYAKVQLRQRLATGDSRCDVLIYLDREKAKSQEGEEYRLEGDRLVSQSTLQEVTLRVEEKLQQRWCSTDAQEVNGRQCIPKIVAESTAMRQALQAVEVVAPTMATVLISGETGVGKEIIARALHAMSPRALGEFIVVNCGAIPENLVETQLFGHERGAFTGAHQVHHGYFERAEKGTLFLDEINSLPLPAQARLLRVLQDGTYERVGGKQALHANVRIVAATNGSVEEMVATGEFRRDLYYRLSVVPIHIPPLRLRKEDLSALVDHLLRRLGEKYGSQAKTLSERAWIRVMTYDWPGNVRELENVLERAFLFARSAVIEELRLGDSHSGGASQATEGEATGLRQLKKQAALEAEDKLIREALTHHLGNVSAVARSMGITPRAVHLKLKAHGIDAGTYRKGGRPAAPI